MGYRVQFNRNRAAKGGRLSFCRTCKQKGEAAYRAANDEVVERERVNEHENTIMIIKRRLENTKLTAR